MDGRAGGETLERQGRDGASEAALLLYHVWEWPIRGVEALARTALALEWGASIGSWARLRHLGEEQEPLKGNFSRDSPVVKRGGGARRSTNSLSGGEVGNNCLSCARFLARIQRAKERKS